MAVSKPHEGKVALVTGAAAGIGQAYAVRFAADGAAVVVVDIADGSETVERIEAAGGRAIAIGCDVADEAAVARLGERAAGFGEVDILVNNAGIYPFKQFGEMSFAEWRRVMSINVDSLFLVTRQFLPAMRAKGWGRVICVSSGMFHNGTPGASHYVASKGAVIGLVRSLAAEVGQEGVTVNAVAPGLTRSAGTSTGFHDEAGLFEKVASVQAIKRTQTPADLEGVVSFLATDDARFITGQTVVVDGGLAHS
ncbi:MAG: SDR family NAD(P)-dependent oxidoreductase [Solirubrobacterales bacterium]